ncbi:aminoglycoside phosphotransferase [Sphingomonas sp. Root710]|uniref:phosphotransferase family protein n=1 Tax=Sphingomonas sp. Root710 TaxID=1736594 RepID=UPI0006FF7E45|nr:phosphotransferase family protein [Sphingomonas sp. Root710]KRB85088.1 aminoglycoside phosphotransferase [Sphingomonas sp. Root710]
MSDFDEAALSRWISSAIPGGARLQAVEKFAGGQSNPTYRVRTDAGQYVLRRKPFGDLLPSAHAIEREYRLISAIHPTGFAVPGPVALCEDRSVIGAVFYLMEMVEGRTFWNGSLPDLARQDRRACYDAMVDTLAALHAIDHEAVGLGDFGRPGNYMQRQIDRWTKQYRAAQTDDIPEVEQLIEWLPRTLPEQAGLSIIHGDYRLDNLIYAADAPRVRAVLDWELATIGDPLADFAYLAMNWVLPHEGGAAVGGVDFAEADIPALDGVVARYCAATGRDGLPDLHWYFAYNLFRTVGIIQGIKKRMIDGNASNARAAEAAARLPSIARAGWAQAEIAGASHGGRKA